MRELANWEPGHGLRGLGDGEVHVWRILTAPHVSPDPYWPLLSRDEQARARRFRHAADRATYVIAHGAQRTILGMYAGKTPQTMQFAATPSGKPVLAGAGSTERLEFNLSHSGDLALLAVSRDRVVGIDVVRWDLGVRHADLAERHFSAAERATLRALSATPERYLEGFFAAWARKEAYVKATGHGVARGFDHFDVTLAPGEPAALLADRHERDAPARWTMVALPAGTGYSAALVAATPVTSVALLDAPVM